MGTALSESTVTLADLKWIRESWSGPVIVKGILIADDAKHPIDEGAAAVVVSNHGGRQLDSVSASLRALPEIVAAVNGQIEVLMDGGVRRGSDVVKAICLGRGPCSLAAPTPTDLLLPEDRVSRRRLRF